jgi:hypothetical protein
MVLMFVQFGPTDVPFVLLKVICWWLQVALLHFAEVIPSKETYFAVFQFSTIRLIGKEREEIKEMTKTLRFSLL